MKRYDLHFGVAWAIPGQAPPKRILDTLHPKPVSRFNKAPREHLDNVKVVVIGIGCPFLTDDRKCAPSGGIPHAGFSMYTQNVLSCFCAHIALFCASMYTLNTQIEENKQKLNNAHCSTAQQEREKGAIVGIVKNFDDSYCREDAPQAAEFRTPDFQCIHRMYFLAFVPTLRYFVLPCIH